jgi:hypothetical protein
MTTPRMTEATLNASLDACIRDAWEGNVDQARHLHEMLDNMLTGRETAEGTYWLTRHAREVLADMHRELSHCQESGHLLEEHVLKAVRLSPGEHHWSDTCNFVSDLRVAIAVANELCEQHQAGKEPNTRLAAAKVADKGDYGMDQVEILKIYDDIASTVGGFREISHH